MHYIIDCITKKYANFKDRAGRKEYIYCSIFFELLFLFAVLVDQYFKSSWMWILVGVLILCIIIPHISLHVRRLHDLNRSGWWLLVIFCIPFGIIISWIVLMCLKGTTGPNKYGEEPT